MSPLVFIVIAAVVFLAGFAAAEWSFQRRARRLREAVSNEFFARLGSLERERDERERILAHMTDGVALIDLAGRFVYGNQRLSNLLGLPLPPAAGSSLKETLPGGPLLDLVAAARDERRATTTEVRLSGTQSLVRATATPVGARGREAVLLVLHDVTEVERLSRVRQDFVANVSHELRTPLTSIRGYAETLLDGALDDEKHRRNFVETIRDQSGRLSAIVADLLSLAELERAGAEPRLSSFDLREVVSGQVASFHPSAERAGLALDLEAGGSVSVSADRVRIEQVVANLLDNALKYTEHGGVKVRLGSDGSTAWCEVEDTGPGIPAADMPRIFERFYRIDKARSRQKGGTGLGLSIVKHVVALHGGDVVVRSNAAGGSTFRFEIPRQPVAAATTAMKAARTPA